MVCEHSIFSFLTKKKIYYTHELIEKRERLPARELLQEGVRGTPRLAQLRSPRAPRGTGCWGHRCAGGHRFESRPQPLPANLDQLLCSLNLRLRGSQMAADDPGLSPTRVRSMTAKCLPDRD